VNRKLTRDILFAEQAALNRLVDQVPSDALLTSISLRSRRDAVAEEIKALDTSTDTTGTATLVFGGPRVQGSRSIDTDFAARSLAAYQDLITKQAVGRVHGTFRQSGPIPDRVQARLNITGTLHGSFGFVLEEEGAEEPQLFPSTVKIAISEVTDLIHHFAYAEDLEFEKALDNIDNRLMISLRDLIKALQDSEGTLRIIESDRERYFNRQAVSRASFRANDSSISEREEKVRGKLVGLSPVARTFDFVREDNDETITGVAGSQLSQAFLSRIKDEGLELGRRWLATISIKTIERSQFSKRSYILTDLTADE
jgi:hypothetical protein